jgi:hypothetical protein
MVGAANIVRFGQRRINAEDLVRLEAARFGHHVARAGRDVRQHPQPRAMAHGRGVQDRVARHDAVEVGEIVQRHDGEVAVRQHGALGLAGGARGVEQPGEVRRRDVRHRHGLAEQLAMVGPAGLDDVFQARRAGRLDGGQVAGGREADAGAGMIEDVAQFRRVQLGVHRHRGEPRMPAGEQHFDVFRHVAHDERHPLARLKREALRQPAGKPRHALGQTGIVEHRPLAETRAPAGRRTPAPPAKSSARDSCDHMLG